MLQKLFQGLAVLAALVLAGCASTGGGRTEIVGSVGSNKTYTIVAHNKSLPDWMSPSDQLNYVVKGKGVSAEQLRAVSDVERSCRLYTDAVHPSKLVAVLSSTAIYALAGYVGVGSGAHAAFKGASFSEYGKYGGAATGLSGAANGTITLGGRTYTFENCGREVFGLFPETGVRVLNKSPS